MTKEGPVLALQLIDLRVGYGGSDVQVIKGISLSLPPKEIMAILGPSGCGKSTLLKTIAGLLQPSIGQVVIGGRDVTSAHPARRNVGLVFQEHSLFPHMTVTENVGYGLRARRVSKAERDARVREMLQLVRLPKLADKLPHELSGGQAQRVALARALAISPELLLMDEPFSSLDARLKEDMRAEVHQLLREMGVSTVLVTHDQEEALELASQIVLIDGGVIVEQGPAAQLFESPQFDFTADFVGKANVLTGALGQEHGHFTLKRKDSLVYGPKVELGGDDDRAFAIMAQDVLAFRSKPLDLPNVFEGTLVDALYRGRETATVWAVDELDVARLHVRSDSGLIDRWTPGERAWLGFRADDVLVVRNWDRMLLQRKL